MRQYGGHVSAIKDKESASQYYIVKADSPLKAVAKLMDQFMLLYPESEGWHSHSTGQAEGLRIY